MKIIPIEVNSWENKLFRKSVNIAYSVVVFVKSQQTVALAQSHVVLMSLTQWRLAVSQSLCCHFNHFSYQTCYSTYLIHPKVPEVKNTIISMVLYPPSCITTPCIALLLSATSPLR